MNKINHTTEDLAALVFDKLQGVKAKGPFPTLQVLKNLFENLFYTSIKTEESEFIKVRITLINSNNPDPSPPKRKVKDRWSFIPFEKPVPFNVKNIVKLSKAADPWSSSLAVDFNNEDNDLIIWGMIDQGIHFQSYLHHESERGPQQPGLFQTSITGIGSLVVIIDYELIATLKQNVLISNYLDVFNHGPVCNLLKKYSIDYLKEIKTFLIDFPETRYDFWEGIVQSRWTQALTRILIRIQNYQHGGALLISNEIESSLDIKHKISYDRLFKSLCNIPKLEIEKYVADEKIWFDYVEENKSVPIDLYLTEKVCGNSEEERRDELKGAIRFISSLSCIDGLVLLDSNLKVKGFGVVIKSKDLPEHIYISKKSNISAQNLIEVSPNHFGTRHQSMFSYCWKHEGSLGFVISQDGDIRAITRVGNKLIMWENIKVLNLYKSRKLKVNYKWKFR